MKRISIDTFDKLSLLLIGFVFGFSFGVALSEWHWFPVEDEWTRMANIPQTKLNYVALLSPGVALLMLLWLRRRFFGGRPI